MAVLKWVDRANRDPANGKITGPEFQVWANTGKISGDVQIETMPGVIAGKDALLCVRKWNPVITNPSGPTLLDYTPATVGLASAGFPVSGDTFWNGLGYSTTERSTYNATEGGKGGIIIEEGKLTILGASDASRITLKEYTQNLGNTYGNAPNILSQPWQKDAAGNYVPTKNKLRLRFVDIYGGDNGVRGELIWLNERDVRYFGAGNGSDQTHARYISARAFISSDCETRDTNNGHDYKTRMFGTAVVYRPKLPRNALKGSSYRWDMGSGDNVLIGGSATDDRNDSNNYIMFRLGVDRDPWGPHSFTMLGFRADADISGIQGMYLNIGDKANAFTPGDSVWFKGTPVWENHDWLHALQLTNPDGSKVWMPITIVDDGNDLLYTLGTTNSRAYSYAGSCTPEGRLKVPAGHAITQLPGANRLIDRASPAAQIDGTRIDLTKLAHLGPVISSMVAAGIDPNYFDDDARMDALVAASDARRAAWSYPVGVAVVPAPAPLPPPPQPVPVPVPVPGPTPEEIDMGLYQDRALAAEAKLAQRDADVLALQGQLKQVTDDKAAMFQMLSDASSAADAAIAARLKAEADLAASQGVRTAARTALAAL